jgi:RNA-binding protein
VTKPHTPLALTGKQRRHLRALAHPLKPVVHVGQAGLTEGVMVAIDQALETHELIKIKFGGEEDVSVARFTPEIESRTLSAVAQVIGKTLVVYRRRKKDPTITFPKTTSKVRKD